MAEFFIDVGKIKLTWQGLWSNATDYKIDDLVHYDDGSTISAYIAVADNTNTVPSVTGTVDTANWNLFASGGLAGGLQPGGTASNQVQYKDGLALGGEVGFTYDPSTDLLTVPSITVSGTSATYDVDVTGSVRATAYYEGANQLTYNISGAQVTSGTIDNARLPADISVTNLTASTGLNVKSGGLIFDDSTNRVGIGTAVPATTLDIRSVAIANTDDIVARFRSDHTTANGTYIEVMPNTAQAQKSGITLHKNSLRTEGFVIENDGGAVVIANSHASSPTITVALAGTDKLVIADSVLTLNNPFRVNGCFDEAVVSSAISAGTLTLDATSGSVFTVNRGADITTMQATLPSGARGVSLTMVFTNTTGSSHSVAWPANTKWAGGGSPTLSSTQNHVDIVTLSTTDGGTSWYGFVGGTDYQ